MKYSHKHNLWNIFFAVAFIGIMTVVEYLPDGFSITSLVLSILLVVLAIITIVFNLVPIIISKKNRGENKE